VSAIPGMRSRVLPLLALLGALGLGAGCANVDVTGEGARNRVLNGTVSTGVALPAGTEIMVRIIAPTGMAPGQPAVSDIPIARQSPAGTERILGEQVQTLAAPAAEAVPFRIEYDADDALLRRGVNLEARVYYNGRVRFRTVNAHVVTLTSAPYPQSMVLQAVER
jgi:hypothetical protein